MPVQAAKRPPFEKQGPLYRSVPVGFNLQPKDRNKAVSLQRNSPNRCVIV